MIEEYEWDIYAVFRDQLEDELPLIQTNISLLKSSDDVTETINELFRNFHTYKSISSYLKLYPLHNLTAKAETVLSSLRENKNFLQVSIIEWLEKVYEQLLLYFYEMQDDITELSTLPDDILTAIVTTKEYINPIEKLKTLSIIYIDNNLSRAEKITLFLYRYAKAVDYSTPKNSSLDLKEYNIAIVNLDTENYEYVKYLQKNFPNLPIVTVFNKISTRESNKLLKLGITHAITNPLNARVLYSELLSIVKSHYSSSNILIEHKKITKFIDDIEPLSDTVHNIMRLCDEEQSDIKDIIQVVKKDPLLSANILQVANSPIYSTMNLKSIDQAVIKFGKKGVKALCVSGTYNSLGTLNLTPYAIDESIFSNIAMMRLALMLKWYSKVSVADLALLSSTAILSNIGQILLSKEIYLEKKSTLFQELCSVYSICYAEEFLMNTTTTYVSAQILRHYNLEADIITILTHSDNPKGAPEEFQKLCVANHIVNTLIDLKGNIIDNFSPQIITLMDEFKLNSDILKKALESIKEKH